MWTARYDIWDIIVISAKKVQLGQLRLTPPDLAQSAVSG